MALEAFSHEDLADLMDVSTRRVADALKEEDQLEALMGVNGVRMVFDELRRRALALTH